jgi:hypothetical protein
MSNVIRDAATISPTESDIIIVGDSHIAAFGFPLHSEKRQFILAEGGPPRIFTVTEKWTGYRGTEYWEMVADHCTDRSVAISWLGNQHQSSFLIATGPSFDFVCSYAASSELQSGATILPLKTVEAFFNPSLSGLRAVLRKLKAKRARDIVVLGTPPPKDAEEFILLRIKTSEFFLKKAAAANLDIALARLTPAATMQKLWSVLQHQMAAIAAQEGLPFLATPRETLKCDGTLRSEYWEDVTHANRNYGDRVRLALYRLLLKDTYHAPPI